MGMLEDFTELLIARGFDMSDVIRGPFVDTPDSQTALIPTPSFTPPLTYCGAIYEIHRLAVQVRRADGVSARNRAQLIYQDLFSVADVIAGASIFANVIPQTAPFWLDEDANGRSVYGVNIEIHRREYVAS